jgi:hypothetical protein
MGREPGRISSLIQDPGRGPTPDPTWNPTTTYHYEMIIIGHGAVPVWRARAWHFAANFRAEHMWEAGSVPMDQAGGQNTSILPGIRRPDLARAVPAAGPPEPARSAAHLRRADRLLRPLAHQPHQPGHPFPHRREIPSSPGPSLPIAVLSESPSRPLTPAAVFLQQASSAPRCRPAESRRRLHLTLAGPSRAG